MTIHKEGYKILSYTFVILAIINLLVFFLFPNSENVQIITVVFCVISFLLVLQFFRNPKRITLLNEKNVIAPADGKVVVIEEVNEDEYYKAPRKQVSIFMSPVNVHINRNPISGIVTYFKYHAGSYFVAWHPKASTENERTTIVIENSKQQSVLFRQIAGALAKRIVWYVKTGEPVVQGEEFGFIKFGSRVDIFLPLNAKINVQLGQKTVGGETVIAEFID